jgi:arginase
VVLLGDRDHDETSAAGLPDPSARGVHHLPIERVRAMGPGGAGADAWRILEQAAPAGVWLHLDVDVLDMRVFPATDYLDPDGMAMDELRDLLTPLARSERLVGMSLGCFNPEKDPDGACGEALVSLLEEALGSAVAGGQR